MGAVMRVRSWSWLLVLFAGPALAAPPAQAPAPESLQGLDAYVRQVMHDWHVPGLAIAVVEDGKIVLARGYGVRELGKPAKVDADTLFDIGSNTKAFTVAALGTLVSAGKLDWDTPAVDDLKSFRLDNAYVTQNITLRDLLTHRSGYCDPSAAWYTTDAADILKRVRYQQPDSGFRAAFCYNNVMYLAASRFIPALTGQSWNDYVTAHLFRPLRMNATVSTEAGLRAAGDVAAPHGMENGQPVVIRQYWPHNMDVFAAVGGIWSSASDMSQWLMMLLDDGKFGDTVVLDPRVVAAMETPQIVVQSDSDVGEVIRKWMPGGHFYTYGLGLFVQDWHGYTLVWHAGDIDGMASALALVPGSHVGVVVLSNMNQANARFAIVTHVLQSMLDQPLHDIEPVLLADAKKSCAESEAAKDKLAATRKRGSSPPLPLRDYAGAYKDDLDGTATVAMDKGRLVLRLGNPDFVGDLQHWHDDTFRVAWRYRFYGPAYVTFDLDAFGKPARIEFAGLPLQFTYVKPATASRNAESP
jgi:CubicO group peptidase (beta-lactamase class C family)